MAKVLEVLLPVEVALPLVVAELVNGLVRVDHLRDDGEEGLGAGLQGEAELDQLRDLDRRVEEGLIVGEM